MTGNTLPAGQTAQAERPRASSALGSPDLYRESLHQLLAGAEAYARIGQQYAEIADDAGMDHAVRCLVAQTRAAVNLLAELKDFTTDLAGRPQASAPRRP